ncbi:unnamed protein product [Caenorhabditis sp. 36 PRJEB53466]|nr:unnamed protein product [Caenorhabditis sp. 36 PRJEB53466]
MVQLPSTNGLRDRHLALRGHNPLRQNGIENLKRSPNAIKNSVQSFIEERRKCCIVDYSSKYKKTRASLSPSSSRSSSPESECISEKSNESDCEEDVTVTCFSRKPEEKKTVAPRSPERPSVQRLPRDFWPEVSWFLKTPTFVNTVAEHSKKFGRSVYIVSEPTEDTDWITTRIYFAKIDEPKLQVERHVFYGIHSAFRVYHRNANRSESHPKCFPSTSHQIKPEHVVHASCSFESMAPDHFYHCFYRKGRFVNLEIVIDDWKEVFAVLTELNEVSDHTMSLEVDWATRVATIGLQSIEEARKVNRTINRMQWSSGEPRVSAAQSPRQYHHENVWRRQPPRNERHHRAAVTAPTQAKRVAPPSTSREETAGMRHRQQQSYRNGRTMSSWSREQRPERRSFEQRSNGTGEKACCSSNGVPSTSGIVDRDDESEHADDDGPDDVYSNTDDELSDAEIHDETSQFNGLDGRIDGEEIGDDDEEEEEDISVQKLNEAMKELLGTPDLRYLDFADSNLSYHDNFNVLAAEASVVNIRDDELAGDDGSDGSEHYDADEDGNSGNDEYHDDGDEHNDDIEGEGGGGEGRGGGEGGGEGDGDGDENGERNRDNAGDGEDEHSSSEIDADEDAADRTDLKDEEEEEGVRPSTSFVVRSENDKPDSARQSEILKEQERRRNLRRETFKIRVAAPVAPPYPAYVKEVLPMLPTAMTRMMDKMHWKFFNMSNIPRQLDELIIRNINARADFEKAMGRPLPRFSNEDELKQRNWFTYEIREILFEYPCHDLEIKQREWKRLCDVGEVIEDFRTVDAREVLKVPDDSERRLSFDEPRGTRLSFDSANFSSPELVQRSHSFGFVATTPGLHQKSPLYVDLADDDVDDESYEIPLESPAAVITPRSSHSLLMPSPVSRHGSMSSTGKPASIQGLRPQNVIFPPDVSVPPPPILPSHDEMMSPPKDGSTSRRSSETIMPLRSPPFTKQPQTPLANAHSQNPHFGTPTGTPSVSSSTASTPRHSFSGTPGHSEPTLTPTLQQPHTPKTPVSSSRPPEKIQVRHDSISKPGPSAAASALQARSQSISVLESKKSLPPTPVVRDAGSDLIDQIMSNQPSMGLKKLPRIEKKPSALINNALREQQPGTFTTSSALPSSSSSSSHPAMMLKDKEREKEKSIMEKKRKERELEKEREARKEMKRKETKEERQKRKEMEKTKREEEERRERKRAKQLMREKEKGKEKEREKERRKAEKGKPKKKRRHRDEDSEETESTDSDDIDLDTRKTTKEMTQEEKDHQLALILSKGSIIENLKSRRRTEKRSTESFEKLRQKSQVTLPTLQRRVLIESSDDDNGAGGGDDDEDEEEEEEEKEKSGSTSDEATETEQTFLRPPTMQSPVVVKEKVKVHKEREKGELTSSSEDEEEKKREKELERQRRKQVVRENRKRQKSGTSYSSDDHTGSKNAVKRKRREDSEERRRKKAWEAKEAEKLRKRKLEHRRSSEDELRRKAKRDFRDVQLEDVSDEEEVEEPPKVRRPSTSSTASTGMTGHEKRGTIEKTPLRVVTPTVTPLQSPKILSPKTATSFAKRPSINSDHESLLSPKARNRTTSSTSTATTASRHEALHQEKPPLSPAVTAKSSVSSIDDLGLREDLSATSAAASPMSATGRPMVLTKAAMKSFQPSPQKKRSKSTNSHDSSSSSSATTSSSSTSSDDSSDEETLQPPEPALSSIPADAGVGDAADDAESVQSIEEDNQPSPLFIPPPPLPQPPVLAAQDASPGLVLSEQSSPSPDILEIDASPSPVAIERQARRSPEVQPETPEREQYISDHEVTIVEKEDKAGPATAESEEASRREEQTLVEPVIDSHAPAVIVEEKQCDPRPPAPEAVPIPERASQPTHSLISDQETDQAYPDFGMPKEQKDTAEKEHAHEFNGVPSPGPRVEEKPTHSAATSSSNDRQHIVGSLSPSNPRTDSPQSVIVDDDIICVPQSHPSSTTTSNEKKKNEPLQAAATTQNSKDQRKQSEEVEVIEVMQKSLSDNVAQEAVLKNEGVINQAEQNHLPSQKNPDKTPADHSIAPNVPSSEVEAPAAVHHPQYQSVHTPIQPHAPLGISVSNHNSQQFHQQLQQPQVVQPSPRAAAPPGAQPIAGQPVSVVQQPRPDNPSFAPNTAQEAAYLAIQKEFNEILNRLFRDEAYRNDFTSEGPELMGRLQTHLFLSAEGKVTPSSSEFLQLHSDLQKLQQKLWAREAARVKKGEEERREREKQEQRRIEEERLAAERKKTEEARLGAERRQAEEARRREENLRRQRLQEEENRRIQFQNMAIMGLLPPEARAYFNRLGIDLSRGQDATQVNGQYQSASGTPNVLAAPVPVRANAGGPIEVQQWFYRTCMMSAEEPSAAIAAAPITALPPVSSAPDLTAMIQQLTAMHAAQAARQQAPSIPVTTSTSNPLANLEALLNTASLANFAASGALNPLSMLALTSSLNQSSPVYQGIARVLLTMNMGQMLATHQTSELLATMNQQEALMTLLAARNAMPFQLPGPQQQQQQTAQQQGGFAVPQSVPHMSLKRSSKDQIAVGVADRKKSCPPLAMVSGEHQGQQQAQQVVAPPPVAPRSPSPPLKSMFANLPPKVKEENEKFRVEILRRLDIILLEELGAEDEEDEKKIDMKQVPTSDEDDTDEAKTESMGAAGSAFRRILSRSSTMGNNSGSPSASGTTTPSTSSLSSGPDSPPLEGDPLSAEFLEMLTNVAIKHKEVSKSEALSLNTVDEAAFLQHFPIIWNGRLALKSSETSINLHLINGSEAFLYDVLGARTTDDPQNRREFVRITQRLRLDNGQVEHIHRILTNPDYACCIGLASATDLANLTKNETALKSSFIDYLSKKQIAGISCFEDETSLKSARVHVFAPGELVSRYLAELAPSMYMYLSRSNVRFLFIVFTNDKTEPNMSMPPTSTEPPIPVPEIKS